MTELDLDALRTHPLTGAVEDIHHLVVWMEQQEAILATLERAQRVNEAVERLRRGILYSEDREAIVAAFLEEVDRG